MSNILDDIPRLTGIDRSHMLSILQRMPEDLEDAIRCHQSYQVGSTSHGVPENVIIAGVGGSSIGGDVISNWASDDAPVPIIVNRGLHLPRFAGQNTLVIAISYSGETKETIGQFEEAKSRHCILRMVTSGGTLGRMAGEHDLPVTRIDPGIPPRLALPKILGAVISILVGFGVVRDLKDAESSVEDLRRLREKLDVSMDTDNNPAKKMALTLVNKSPIIYALERMSGAARRFKNQLNENSKVHSKFDTIPEICHNEVESWPELASEPWRSKYSFIFIRDEDEDEKETRIVQGTLDYLRKLGIDHFSEIVGNGSNRLARLLTAIYTGDYVSYYLAITRGVDPTPIDGISGMKKMIR